MTPGSFVFVLSSGMTAHAFLVPQLRALRSAGAAVEVVCGRDEWSATLAAETGCMVHELEIERSTTGWRDLRALWRLVRLLRGRSPATVVASTPKGLLYGMAAARLARVPRRIAYYRGLVAASAAGPKRSLAFFAEWSAARCATEHVVVSESLRQEAQERRVLRPGQGLVIGAGMSRGINAGALREAATTAGPSPALAGSGCRFLWLGRCAHRKGFDTLAAAWPLVRSALPDAILTIVGAADTQDPPRTESLAILEHDDAVRWVGHAVSVAPWLAACDVLLFPSAGEGFPNAPMEAAVFEVPTVGFDVMGVRDAVHHLETGILVAERSPDAFAAAAVSLGRDLDLRRRLGIAARQRVEASHDEDRVTQDHVAYFLGTAPAAPGASRGP